MNLEHAIRMVIAAHAEVADSPLATFEQREPFEAKVRDALGHGVPAHAYRPSYGDEKNPGQFCWHEYPYSETALPPWPWAYCGLPYEHSIHDDNSGEGDRG